MKRIVLFGLLALMMVGLAEAETVDTYISANTVSFNSVNYSVQRGPRIITFNSVTKYIKLLNLSRSVDCYADLTCRDTNGKRGFSQERSVLLPAIGSVTPNSVELDFATRNLSFSSAPTASDAAYNEASYGMRIHYVVTGDSGSF